MLTFLFPQGEHPTGDDLNSGLYDVMRKELRNAVEEIRMELEQVCPLKLCFFINILHPLFCLLTLLGFLVQAVTTKVNDNCMQSKNLNSLQTVSTIRRNYATKLEQVSKV